MQKYSQGWKMRVCTTASKHVKLTHKMHVYIFAYFSEYTTIVVHGNYNAKLLSKLCVVAVVK